MTRNPSPRRLLRALAVAAAAAGVAPGAAHAGKTLCCVNAQGRNICGDILPQECYGRAYREVNERGMTIRQIEAPLTPEQRAQRDAEAERKKQAEIAAREEKRRNEALLNTYASEKDIDIMRDRTLDQIAVAAKEVESKYAETLKRKKRLDGELEFYKKKPVPDTLKEQIKVTDIELKAQLAAVEAKKREMEQVVVRFAEEKQRFIELKQGVRKMPALPPAPAAPR